MIDDSAIGRTGAPFRVLIERGKVLEFARAVRASDQVEDNRVVTGTFLTTAGLFWQPAESNPLQPGDLDSRRVLHGEQEFVYHGPPPSSPTTLIAQTSISSVRTREGNRGGTMRLIDIVTEYRDETGALVAESRSTAVETARPPAAE